MSGNTIERVRAPSPDVFYREYVLPQRPVILTSLFDESPLRKVETLEAALTALGDISVEIRTNYMAGYFSPATQCRSSVMTLGAYLNLLRQKSETQKICVEHPTPEALLDKLPLKLYRHIKNEGDLYSNLFIAGTGNYAHLHYDSDQRDVLLYQVFGVKRILVIHPRETPKLDTLDWENLRRTSAICLEHASEADRAAFIKYTNGHDALVLPGETMFIPAMAWHYIEYVSPAMSIAYRLGRNQYNWRLAALFPDPSIDVQALALLLHDADEASTCHTAWLEELERAGASALANKARRSEVLQQLCLAIRTKYSNLDPIYSMREWERRRLLALRAPELLRRDWREGSRRAHCRLQFEVHQFDE